MKSLKKNNILIVILFAIAVFMSVGFALLSTTLNINGQAVVKSNTWDIHFENVAITEGSVTAIKDAVIANEAATLVEYEMALEKPGDYYEFTVDAVNDGTLDSMIEMVTLSGIEGHEEYINYQVTYLDGTEIQIGDALNAGTSETYKIRIEYKKDIENLPSEDITLSLVFGVTYSQSKGGEVITNYYTLTGTAYGVDGNPLTEGEIEVHSKIITAPINSDGKFILKDIPVGQHEIYIKDSAGNIINSGTFTLQTGDKTTIENNIVTAFSNGTIELNIKTTEETVILKNVCEYEVGQTWEFAYTGDIQEFNIPCAGVYEMTVTGGQGGQSGNVTYPAPNYNMVVSCSNGSNGNSVSGQFKLDEDKKLYVVVGGKSDSCAWANNNSSSCGSAFSYGIAGYNGGIAGTCIIGGSGGATHIGFTSQLIDQISDDDLLISAYGGEGRSSSSIGGKDYYNPNYLVEETYSTIGAVGDSDGYAKITLMSF